MNGVNQKDAALHIVDRIDRACCPAFKTQLPTMIEAFLRYDLEYMYANDILTEKGNQGGQEYDEDDAFEYILEKYLADVQMNDDDLAMQVAAVLDQYFALQYEYLLENGLVEKA